MRRSCTRPRATHSAQRVSSSASDNTASGAAGATATGNGTNDGGEAMTVRVNYDRNLMIRTVQLRTVDREGLTYAHCAQIRATKRLASIGAKVKRGSRK